MQSQLYWHISTPSKGDYRSKVIFYGQLCFRKAFPWSEHQARLSSSHAAMSHCTKALRTLMRNTNEKHIVFPGAARQSIFHQTSIVLLHTDQELHPKCLLLSAKSWESTSETRDSSSCSALEPLKEQASFHCIKLSWSKNNKKKNPTEATKITPSSRQAGRELITTFTPQLLSHLPQQK